MASFSQGWFYIHNAILNEVAVSEQTTDESEWEDPRSVQRAEKSFRFFRRVL